MPHFIKIVPGSAPQRIASRDVLERIKRHARQISREQGIPHHRALELAAQQQRFDNWHQVAVALANTEPSALAVRRGIVLAVDIKDAIDFLDAPDDGFDLPGSQGSYRRDELVPLLLSALDPPNAPDEDDLDECVFYRYVGHQRLSTLTDILDNPEHELLVSNGGFLTVGYAQVSRASIDTAEMTREILPLTQDSNG